MRETGWYKKTGVTVLEGRWQDHVESDVLMSEGFDIIYTDTFSEQYGDLMAFFEHVPNLVRDERSRLSFFNGLGATNAVFSNVYTELVELHLGELGMKMKWYDVPVLSEESDVWGKTVVYFDLPLYKMPICRMKY